MKKLTRFPARADLFTPPVRWPHGGIEVLEARIAPAAVVAPATFTYTDSDGDVVRVTLSGKGGSVEFLDANGGDVAAQGGNLAKIVVTKPSADFAISFTDTNNPVGAGVGDNVINLGTITGPGDSRLPVIRGVFTAASTDAVSYRLGGFFGTDFSSGGGLSIVGSVTGDGVGATTDVNLKSLARGNSLVFTSVDAGASVGVEGRLSGSLRTMTLSGDLTVGTIQGLVQVGEIAGTLTVNKDISGRLTLGDPDPLALARVEEVTVKGSVMASAFINASSDLTLNVGKDLGGNILTGGTLRGTISGGIKMANVVVGDDLLLDVAGPVAGSSIVVQQTILTGSVFKKGMTGTNIVGGTGLTLEVTGSVLRSRVSGGTASMDVNISGRVAGSQFLSGGDAIVTTGFTVENSSIVPDGRLTLTVGTQPQGATQGVGDLSRSTIGSKSTSALVSIGGKVMNSQFTTATDLNLTVGTSVEGSGFVSGNDLELRTGTNVLRNRFAVGSDADLTIGGQLAGSVLLVSNNLTATVGQAGVPVQIDQQIVSGIAGTRIETSDGSASLTVVGPITGTVIDSGQSVTINSEDLTGLDPVTNTLRLLRAGNISADTRIIAAVDSSVTSSGVGRVAARVVAGQNAALNINGAFNGSVAAANDVTFSAASVALTRLGLRAGGDLSFVATGKVVAPLIDIVGNVKDFRVGGDFGGVVNVGGNFLSGLTTASATVIGGAVSASTLLRVGGDLGGDGAAPEFIFGRGFGGRIEVNGDVVVDLTFNGSVNRIAVDGAIGPVPQAGPGDAVADIIIRGKLRSLTSASIFSRGSALGGDFVDAAGTTTGVLQVDGGAPLVGPLTS